MEASPHWFPTLQTPKTLSLSPKVASGLVYLVDHVVLPYPLIPPKKILSYLRELAAFWALKAIEFTGCSASAYYPLRPWSSYRVVRFKSFGDVAD